ncbi:MAG TPA: substrate-binding domain-containing protein, partial [Candidatus Brocadiia bacterium]|nr:substrate-binding domain-containing protein [Candidatus Brocadiia bacterium]
MQHKTWAIDANNSAPLHERVRLAVVRQILEGHAAVNDKLPTETALAQTLGVGRLTVRKAYLRLRDQGVLIQRQGSGTFVAPGAHAALGAPCRRRLRRVVYVLGASDLSQVGAPWRFLVGDYAAGMSSALSGQATNLAFTPGLAPADAPLLLEADGVIIGQPQSSDDAVVRELRQRGTPVVYIGHTGACAASVFKLMGALPGPSVGYDRAKAVRLACDHLVSQGFRRIGYIGSLEAGPGLLHHKLQAFISSLLSKGIDVSPKDIVRAEVQFGQAFSAARKRIALGDLPQAFFVDTDFKAIEVLAALRESGLSVPDDISIVGYDDIPDAAESDPPLTTIRTPRVEIGRQAIEVLCRSQPQSDIILEPELRIRA